MKIWHGAQVCQDTRGVRDRAGRKQDRAGRKQDRVGRVQQRDRTARKQDRTARMQDRTARMQEDLRQMRSRPVANDNLDGTRQDPQANLHNPVQSGCEQSSSLFPQVYPCDLSFLMVLDIFEFILCKLIFSF